MVGDLLRTERGQTLARLRALADDFDDIVIAAVDANGDDEHDPEGSTIAFERTRVATLRRQAQAYLAELDQALARLVRGTYGQCEGCGRPISPERLRARPTARLCIACAGQANPRSLGRPG